MGKLTRAPSRCAPAPSRGGGAQAGRAVLSLEGVAGAAAGADAECRLFAAKARAKDGERLILDHVVERKDGGAPLDPANTQWLTFSELQAKTEREKRRRSCLGGRGRR